VEVAVGKAATRRYETQKSGADSSQGSSLSLLVAKKKTKESFFSKPYIEIDTWIRSPLILIRKCRFCAHVFNGCFPWILHLVTYESVDRVASKLDGWRDGQEQPPRV